MSDFFIQSNSQSTNHNHTRNRYYSRTGTRNHTVIQSYSTRNVMDGIYLAHFFLGTY